MLFALRCERAAWFAQKGLRVLLGVSAQTVSRMIQSLVEDGFLVKRVVATDRRRRELAFTDQGRERMGRAVGQVVLGGLGNHVAGRALTDQGWPSSPAKRAEAHDEFAADLDLIRFGFRDNAFFEYAREKNEEPGPIYACFRPEYLVVEDSTPDLTTLDDDPDDADKPAGRQAQQPTS
jgi:DNA-binding MarR family transcriptional regulator